MASEDSQCFWISIIIRFIDLFTSKSASAYGRLEMEPIQKQKNFSNKCWEKNIDRFIYFKRF